jgi:hypothetical protein
MNDALRRLTTELKRHLRAILKAIEDYEREIEKQ